MRTKRRILAGKIEAVEGVAEVLTAAEAGILAIDVKWSPDIKMVKRIVSLPTLSKLQDIPGMAMASISFKVELMGLDSAFAADNLPLISPYLKCCGFEETLDLTGGAETVTYAPASTDIPSMTIAVYSDGVIKKLTGARGSVKFTANNGEPIYAEFTFMGAYVAPIDGAILVPTYLGILPPMVGSALFTIDVFAPVLKSFSLDMGNKVAPREDMNAASGYKSFMLTDRDPRGNFDPEMELIATHDWYARWKAGTTGALSIGAIGSTQYNRVTFGAPALGYTKVSEGDREGIETANTDFQLSMGSGDDEVTIEFS